MDENPINRSAEGDDAELVGRSLSGDRAAFGRLVRRHQALICSLAYSATGSLSQSEDLAQETFIVAWRQLAELREPAKLRAWLCGIVRNLIHNALRRDRREPAHAAESLEDAAESPATDALPSDAAVTREEATLLWRALENIPESYREPLILFYRQQQSIEQVAAALDLSEEVVKQRLSRGRKLLQAELEVFVAGALRRSAPREMFSLGVMALLSTTTMTGKVGAVGTVAGKTGLLAKTAAMLSIAGPLAMPAAMFLDHWLGRKEREEQWRILPEEARARIKTAKVAGRRDAVIFLLGAGLIGVCAFAFDPGFGLEVCVGLPIAMLLFFPLRIYFRIRPDLRRIAELEKKNDLARRGVPILPLRVVEYRSRWSVLGLPLIHRVKQRDFGTRAERRAPVKAWIAIASPFQPITAYGVLFAVGRRAFAPVSFGGVSVGLVSLGGISFGALVVGGIAVGGWAAGFVSAGYFSAGLLSVAWIAAHGLWAFAREFATGMVSRALHANDPIAEEFFRRSFYFSALKAADDFRGVFMFGYASWIIWAGRRGRRKLPVTRRESVVAKKSARDA